MYKVHGINLENEKKRRDEDGPYCPTPREPTESSRFYYDDINELKYARELPDEKTKDDDRRRGSASSELGEDILNLRH